MYEFKFSGIDFNVPMLTGRIIAWTFHILDKIRWSVYFLSVSLSLIVILGSTGKSTLVRRYFLVTLWYLVCWGSMVTVPFFVFKCSNIDLVVFYHLLWYLEVLFLVDPQVHPSCIYTDADQVSLSWMQLSSSYETIPQLMTFSTSMSYIRHLSEFTWRYMFFWKTNNIQCLALGRYD